MTSFRSARLRPLGLAILLAGLGASPARADLGGFVIREFDTDLTVEEGSDLQVEERVTVDFLEPRHGLYRTIPIRYTDRRGFVYSMRFRLLEVTDENGVRQRTHLNHQGRYINIRIGDPDRTVSGRVVYVIRYRVGDALGSFPEHDELYWNATGNEWNASIDRATATIHLPAALPADSLETASYAGRFGEREQRAQISYPHPGSVSFRLDQPLAPLEGLTVVAAWPKGYVRFPSPVAQVARVAADNWILLMPCLSLGFLMWVYVRRGRDPQGPVSVVVRYEPPKGVGPGELGAVMDENVDLRDLTAVVIDLAVRGYLVIREEERPRLFSLGQRKETIFERKADKPDGDLLPHEKLVLGGLFASGDVVASRDLKEAFYLHVPGIQNALYGQLARRGYFVGNPRSVKNRYRGLGFLAGLLVAGVGMGWAYTRGGIFPNAATVPVISAIGTLIVFFAMAPAMPKRTRAGVELRNWAIGFREFVHRVEGPRLEADDARVAFERLLPHAMALGLASAWARRFEGLYQSSPPTWYVGATSGHGFSTRDFEQNLSSSMREVGRQMIASPRSSSGSGGGGSSGGGGGGGGGGSW